MRRRRRPLLRQKPNLAQPHRHPRAQPPVRRAQVDRVRAITRSQAMSVHAPQHPAQATIHSVPAPEWVDPEQVNQARAPCLVGACRAHLVLTPAACLLLALHVRPVVPVPPRVRVRVVLVGQGDLGVPAVHPVVPQAVHPVAHPVVPQVAADSPVAAVAPTAVVPVAVALLVPSVVPVVAPLAGASQSGQSAKSSTICKPRRSVACACRRAMANRCAFRVGRA